MASLAARVRVRADGEEAACAATAAAAAEASASPSPSASSSSSSEFSGSSSSSDAHLLVSAKRAAALDATKTAPALRRRRVGARGTTAATAAGAAAARGGASGNAPSASSLWSRLAFWRQQPQPAGLMRRGRRTGGLPHLSSYDDLPEYLRDNEFILSSYRRGEQGVWPSVRTLFGLHNETGNVWTHLVGCVLFFVLALWFASHPPAPLAITASHVEHMARAHWSRHGHPPHLLSPAGGGNGGLGERLSAGVHALESSVSRRVHALESSVAAGVHALEHSVSAGVHAIEETVAAALHHTPHTPPPEAALAAAKQLVARARASAARALHPGAFVYPAPRWPVYVYFAGAMVCLGTSTVCHLLGCCSQHVVALVWRFDYVGIAALIVASFVPAVYYAFLCEPYLRAFYLTTTIAFGAGVVAVSLPDRFQAPEYRSLRAVVFSALGMWGVFPVGHQLLLHRGAWAVRTAFGLDALMGAIYLGGAAIYACRVPERWYPGRFDIVGHSHQLWHTAVVLAAYVHYRAVLVLLEWRDASGGCAAPDLIGQGPLGALRADYAARGVATLGGPEELWSDLSARLAERYASEAAMAMGGGAPAAALP